MTAGTPAARGGGHRTAVWLRAMRLQFYPMTWLAYSLGAVAALPGAPLDTAAYATGFAVLVLLEMATVFTNELADYDTDRRNAYAGPFNGGSRVLTEGRLTVSALRTGAGVAFAGALTAVTLMLAAAPPGQAWAAAAIVAGFGALALSYTLPPLRLAYRGAAEITVAVTHSTGPVLLGYVLQGGTGLTPLPWLLSLPLLVAILPSILLAGIPDSAADRTVAKRTCAVRRGAQRAARLAQTAVLAALLTAALVAWAVGPVYGTLGAAVGLHGLVLLALLQRYRHRDAPIGRIDILMVTALSYLFWFAVLPLVVLTG